MRINVIGRHGQRFDPHPNWYAAELGIVENGVGETLRSLTNILFATSEDEQFAGERGRHCFTGAECFAGMMNRTVGCGCGAVGLDDHEHQV